jgi:hypothetical protein
MALWRPDADELVAFGVAAICVVAALGVASRARHANAAAALAPQAEIARREIHVPHASDTLHLDGELTEPSWRASARTGAFLTREGKEAVPYTDARLVWTDDALRLGLYASDIDIISAKVPPDGPVWDADSFHVVLEKNGIEHELDVGPTCVLTDGVRQVGGSTDYHWQSDAKLACDSDGTVDVAGDRDEEWVVEMVIPLQALELAARAGETVNVRIRRCDVDGSAEGGTSRAPNVDGSAEGGTSRAPNVDSKHSPKRCAEVGLAVVFD